MVFGTMRYFPKENKFDFFQKNALILFHVGEEVVFESYQA